MDFHEAISVDISEPDKLLKTFIFSTVIILCISRIFCPWPDADLLSPQKRKNIRPHVSLTYGLK